MPRRINYYVDSIHPEQLMLNIASGSLAQEKILKLHASLRRSSSAGAARVVRSRVTVPKKRPTVFDNHCLISKRPVRGLSDFGSSGIQTSILPGAAN